MGTLREQLLVVWWDVLDTAGAIEHLHLLRRSVDSNHLMTRADGQIEGCPQMFGGLPPATVPDQGCRR
jgi:hypothetical protein